MPRTHNYTSPSWGHSTSNWKTEDKGMTASCCGWGKGIRKDDFILLKNGDGTYQYQFVEIDYFHDPSDMWKAKLKFAPRS
jgi:hypothetical protein